MASANGITSNNQFNFEQTCALNAVEVKPDRLLQSYLSDTVGMEAFCEISHIIDDLIEHLTAGLHAFVGFMVFFEGKNGQG